MKEAVHFHFTAEGLRGFSKWELTANSTYKFQTAANCMETLWVSFPFSLLAAVGLMQKLLSEFLWAVTCRRSSEIFIAGPFRSQICKALDHAGHCSRAWGKLQWLHPCCKLLFPPFGPRKERLHLPPACYTCKHSHSASSADTVELPMWHMLCPIDKMLILTSHCGWFGIKDTQKTLG